MASSEQGTWCAPKITSLIDTTSAEVGPNPGIPEDSSMNGS